MVFSTKPRRFDRDVDGILLLDKPLGLSSNAALQQARGLYRALKAGHAGSLDPSASGMLPLCFGQATKVCAFLLDSRKSYRFTAKLGERTNTGDAEGETIERQPIPQLQARGVTATLGAFLGDQKQVPPMYSALKHDGERLYTLARRGETVERAPRNIFIESIELLALRPEELEIEVRCSKGTYVRTLAEDIAARLGTLAHLTALRRLDVDPFAGRAMHSLAELQERPTLEALDELLLPVDLALSHLPAHEFGSKDEAVLLSGQAAQASARSTTKSSQIGDQVRMYGPEHHFLGLGEIMAQGLVQPRRLFVNRQ